MPSSVLSLFTLPEIDVRTVKSVKSFVVRVVTRHAIQDFIERWHYSNNMNGVRSEYCFGMFYDGELIGGAVFADPATPGVKESYSEDGTKRVIELRRLCCVDNTPRNTESFFIGKMLNWLRVNTDVDIVLAYSDLTHGHVGIIYKASNFSLVGFVPPIDVIDFDGRTFHDKSLRAKYKGKRKPFAIALEKALDNGDAQWKETKGKNVYLYHIKR